MLKFILLCVAIIYDQNVIKRDFVPGTSVKRVYDFHHDFHKQLDYGRGDFQCICHRTFFEHSARA